MICVCGGSMYVKRKKIVFEGKNGSFPTQTKVYVCRECGREVAAVSFAYEGDTIFVRGEEEDGETE